MSESEYFKSLNHEDKERYKNKLTLTNGDELIDPCTLTAGWKDDITKLPPISWRDVTEYLIESPSIYTKESLKAYKSLEAYDYFVCGHVQQCFFQFCYVKSQVLPSQRQGKSSALYDVWVCLNKEHGWVFTANCTCMAGLGSACSHIAALLIKLETAVHLKLNEPTAATSKLCAWKACKTSVTPAPLKRILFKRPKHGELPSTSTVSDETDNEGSNHYSFSDPTFGLHGISQVELQRLQVANPEAAVFTSLDSADISGKGLMETDNAQKTASETESESENEGNCLPEPLVSLFDPIAINLSSAELLVHAKALYGRYERSYNQASYDLLCERTERQSSSPLWMLHRAGRITASTCHQVAHTNETSPSRSLIAQIMQYTEPVNVKYTRYGKKMEPNARKQYAETQSIIHRDFSVAETGFHVDANVPYLGASPDGLVSCTCHPKRVLEIKCSYKYQEGLVGWETDKQFPMDSDRKMKTSHKYYYQIQLQMLICDVNFGDFFIFSPSKTNSHLLCTVEKDEAFCNTILAKLNKVFTTALLPEIVSRSRDDCENDRKLYCECRRPSFGPMIACDASKCPFEWFHYTCVSITRAPRGKWFCVACRQKSK